VADLRRLDRTGALAGKLFRFLDFAPPGYPQDVPDPYYDGRFEYVYELVDRGQPRPAGSHPPGESAVVWRCQRPWPQSSLSN
jgi:hypothetical protein